MTEGEAKATAEFSISDEFWKRMAQGPQALKEWLEQDVDNMIFVIVAMAYKISAMDNETVHIIDLREIDSLQQENGNGKQHN